MTLDVLTDVQFVLLIVVFWAGVCLLATAISKRIVTRIRQRAVRQIALERLETYCDPATPLEADYGLPAFLREPYGRVATGGSGSDRSVAKRLPSRDEKAGGCHTGGVASIGSTKSRDTRRGSPSEDSCYQTTTLIFPAKTRETR